MRLLVTRTSPFGDVIMTIPVLQALALQNGGIDITVMSKERYAPLFASLLPDVHFVAPDLMGDYRGLGGLRRLVRDYKVKDYDAVADLHDVLRSKYIRHYAKLYGRRVAVVEKDRDGRKALVRQRGKRLEQLPSTFERYARVFRSLGLRCDLEAVPTASPVSGVGDSVSVGVAPFAAQEGKIYPIDKMRQVVEALAASGRIDTIYLFGGGQPERDVLEQWEREIPNVRSVAGRLAGLDKDLDLMRSLRLMISMDSANMQLASLAGIPVVSVWGATHPLSGYLGWGQSLDNVIQTDLPCRPCSIFGNKPCLRGDYACLGHIKPQAIVDKALSLL